MFEGPIRTGPAFFRDERGVQHCISTKTEDRKRALVICQEFEKAAKLKRTKAQTQRTIDRLHVSEFGIS